MSPRTRNRLLLLLIAALFFAPVVLALLLQTPWFHWDPVRTRNYGTLLRPVVAMSTWPAERLRESGFAFPTTGVWTLVYHPGGPCADRCLADVDLLTRVRETQHRQRTKLRLRLLVPPGTELVPSGLPPPWQVERYDPTAEAGLREALGLGVGPALFLIDPMDQAMLRFPMPFDGNGVRRDVQRLLRWSKAGEPAGGSLP